MKTIQFGIHYMLDCYGADPAALANKENLTSLLQTIPNRLGMHTISDAQVVEVGPLNTKDSGGVSGFVMIAESHISFHTFPGRRFASVDVYTCQETIDNETLTKLFTEHFQCTDYEETVIPRGTRYPAEDV